MCEDDEWQGLERSRSWHIPLEKLRNDMKSRIHTLHRSSNLVPTEYKTNPIGLKKRLILKTEPKFLYYRPQIVKLQLNVTPHPLLRVTKSQPPHTDGRYDAIIGSLGQIPPSPVSQAHPYV